MTTSPRPPLTGKTRLVGVIGWPIEHSVSPPMHNAAFEALGLDWCYVPFAVAPERVAEALSGVRVLGLRGINATVPHKQALLSLVDELTPAARAIGAVNTVVIAENGRTLGHNTDAAGFLRSLREAGVAPEGASALVLGAGGAARAVVYALASIGARVTILNRTPARAEALAADMAGAAAGEPPRAGALTPEALVALGAGADLVVNSTSLGMWPHTETSPWPEEVPFPGGAFLYDLVYNPRRTRLMAQAEAAGARAVDGLRMLVHQGAEALTMWTGVAAPVEVMYRACERALEGG